MLATRRATQAAFSPYLSNQFPQRGMDNANTGEN